MDFEAATRHAQWLQALRRDVEACHQESAPLCSGPSGPNPAQINQLIAIGQSHYNNLLFRYGKAASEFKQKGFPGLGQELESALHDIEETGRIYAQMQASTKRHQAELDAIRAQTEDYCTQIRSEVMAHRQMVHDESFRRWSQAFRSVPYPGVCGRCGRSLDMYGRCPMCAW